MKKTVILSLIMVMAATGLIQAQTYHVPSQIPYIRWAVDMANNGDEIVIAPGTYRGPENRNIRFEGKAITVRSTNPDDPAIVAATIIDCQNYGQAFSFYDEEDANSVLDGLTIINGFTNYYDGGGGICCYNSSPTIRNCVIKNCSAWHGGGGICCDEGLMDFETGKITYPAIINCTISGNKSIRSYGGGGIYCKNSSPTITDCTITENIIDGGYGGGGIFCGDMSRPKISNCFISGNRAVFGRPGNLDGKGGGIYCGYDCSLTISDSVIVGNTAAEYGGGVYFAADGRHGRFEITNCTIAGNRAGDQGGGIYYFAEYSVIVGNVLWGNSDSSGTGIDAQIHPAASWDCEDIERESMTIAYNCIQDDNPNDTNIPFDCPDSHNINDDPQFVRNPDDGGDGWGIGGNDDYGDLHLKKSSPCINAGWPGFFATAGNVDIDGQPRKIGPVIDIGADEYAPMITVTQPAGGETWAGGSEHQISWDSFGFDGNVAVKLSSNAGANWQIIESNLADTGSLNWLLPENIDSNQCLISVAPAVADSNVYCINSGLFTIQRFRDWPGRLPQGRGPGVKSGPVTGCVKWQFDTAGPVTAAATVSHNNRVYIASEDGRIYALNGDDGSLRWSYDTNSPLLGSPAVSHNGNVYAGGSDGKLCALDKNGKLLWTHSTAGLIYASAVVSADGNIYAGSQDGALYALDSDGTELWKFQPAGVGTFGGSVFATPAVAEDGTVYAGRLYDPNLYALNPADGSVKWTCNFAASADPCDPNGTGKWPFASAAVADDGTIYQTLIFDSNLYAIDSTNGDIIWSTELADPCSGYFEPRTYEFWKHTIISYNYLNHSDGWSQPAVGPDGTIYVSFDDPYLRAVNPDSSIKWVTKLGEVGGFTLTVDKDGLIYAASDDKKLYVVNPDGQQISEFEGDGWLAGPAIANGQTIIVSDANDTVWAISENACDGGEPVLQTTGDSQGQSQPAGKSKGK